MATQKSLNDGEVVREVSERIDQAINDNRGRERVIVGVLIVMFVVGLGLILYGAISRSLQLLVPGGVIQVALVFPVRRLIKLREDNVRLQIIPQLLRLADSREAKVLAARLIRRMIEQV